MICNCICTRSQLDATHCNTLQRTATHFSTLQHAATHLKTLYTYTHIHIDMCTHDLQLHTASHCNTLQHTWKHSIRTHCYALQHTNTLQHAATHLKTLYTCTPMYIHMCGHMIHNCICTLQHTASHCNTFQHTETHCNTLPTNFKTMQT